jgi:RimJ/RimL family protein N-acetyltransferase
LYKVLKRQFFSFDNYSIIPIRYDDRFSILKWRNEQIYHLRQNKLLTVEDQENYFSTIVSKLFDQEKPAQILFSYMEDNVCIGYGGLVHINWIDKNAEISFIMNTVLEENDFEKHWGIFLKLIEEVGFGEMNLHKISTYALDLRPRLYSVLENSGFAKEAVFKKHCLLNSEYVDVVIHSKFRIG